MRNELIVIGGILVIMLTMAGIAAAEGLPDVLPDPDDDPQRIYGTITDANGDPIGIGHTVEIKKDHNGLWHSINGSRDTDANGNYDTGYVKMLALGYGWPSDNYRMYLDGNLVATTTVHNKDWVWESPIWQFKFSYRWDVQIPEFPTIAIPIVSVIGMLFILQNKKKRT